MASNRHLGRIVAFQSLYEYDFRLGSPPAIKPLPVTKRNLKQYGKTIGDTEFVFDLVEGVIGHQQELDDIIAPAAPDWPVEQIARVDKIILRMAVYELRGETPPKVIINEAVELAKSFGGENSSKFVNGVLGTIYGKPAKSDKSGSKAKSESKAKPRPKSSSKPAGS